MDVISIAENLDNAAMKATPIDQLSNEVSLKLDDAYKMQAASISRRIDRGEKLIGYKLGFTSKAKMEQMGVHELIWGRLTDAMYYKNAGVLSLDKFIHPRAEPEIAFLISNDVLSPVSVEDATQYIQNYAVAIEIIDSRYKNFKFSLEDVIADNCSSSAFVVGDWMSNDLSLENLPISLLINGEEVQSGNSNDILGNPLESFAEATRILSKYGETLKKGMILLAGAATPAVYISEGDKIEAVCKDLGSVSINAVGQQ